MLVTFNPGLTNTKSLRNNCCGGGKNVAFEKSIDYSQITRPGVARSLAARLIGGFEDKTPDALVRIKEALNQPDLHPDARSYLTTAVKQFV